MGLLSQFKCNVAKVKNVDFANGTMAMCALIASADGIIDESERNSMASLISTNETLKLFPAEELQAKFNTYCDKIDNESDMGRIHVLQTIVKLRKAPEQARSIVQIGIVIGSADGDFDKNERRAVSDVCVALGLPTDEFDL